MQLKSKNIQWEKQLSQIPKMAASPFPILLTGPSGTGKEVIAKYVHHLSSRSQEKMISVNCCALSESLVESELFGHVKGSYTGAISDRKGAFESARNGTLFLDEIGDLPLPLQAKLLRAIENNEIRAVGSDKLIETNVRIIAATHENLIEKVNNGDFRKDLFFRLNVLQINTPNLIDRIEDFEELLFFFAKQFKVRFSNSAIDLLKTHDWPGNVRELRNVVAKGAALFQGLTIDEERVRSLIPFSQDNEIVKSTNLKYHEFTKIADKLPLIKEHEKDLIIKILYKNSGHIRRTAQELGVPKSTFFDKLKYYKIDTKQFKEIRD